MLCTLAFSWWKRKTLCHQYLVRGLSWHSRFFRTVHLILCNSIRNLIENTNYTCRLFLYESLWRETVSDGQTYHNKSKPSVLKLSIGSSTSPESWQKLKDKFFGIRQHLHNDFCSIILRFFTREIFIGNVGNAYITCLLQVPVRMTTDTIELQNNYSMKSALTKRNIKRFNWACLKNLRPSIFGR